MRETGVIQVPYWHDIHIALLPPCQWIVLTCFAENLSISWSTFSWHSGWVASKYVAKDRVLVVVSYPAIRKRKAWPAISSSVNVFWTFSDGVLPAGGTSFWLEVVAGLITSKQPAAKASAELRESSIHWRKSLRLCRIQDERKHKEWDTEWCLFPCRVEGESCLLFILCAQLPQNGHQLSIEKRDFYKPPGNVITFLAHLFGGTIHICSHGPKFERSPRFMFASTIIPVPI